jgi:hypothetical protein
MNPLLYKAHPLLYLSVDLLINPAGHSLGELGRLVLIYLASNLVFAFGMVWLVKKAGWRPVSWLSAYALSGPAILAYLPIMATLLGDILAHQFRFEDRFILVFCIFVAIQMLGVFYALAIRQPRAAAPVGLANGMATALFLWLLSLPLGLALLGLNASFKFI